MSYTYTANVLEGGILYLPKNLTCCLALLLKLYLRAMSGTDSNEFYHNNEPLPLN